MNVTHKYFSRCYRRPTRASGHRKKQNAVEVGHATNGWIYWHTDRVVAALLIYMIERGSLGGWWKATLNASLMFLISSSTATRESIMKKIKPRRIRLLSFIARSRLLSMSKINAQARSNHFPFPPIKCSEPLTAPNSKKLISRRNLRKFEG